jgi:hypothetical protein
MASDFSVAWQFSQREKGFLLLHAPEAVLKKNLFLNLQSPA